MTIMQRDSVCLLGIVDPHALQLNSVYSSNIYPWDLRTPIVAGLLYGVLLNVGKNGAYVILTQVIKITMIQDVFVL